jgi:glycosyltransferase involved in cell wall biosynthesis
LRIALVGPTHPAPGGVVHFTAGLADALARRGLVATIGWRRGYPARFHPGTVRDLASEQSVSAIDAAPVLDFLDPRTWWRAAAQICHSGAQVAVVQWVHPIHAPVIALLSRALKSRGIGLVLICHNVEPHESNPAWRLAARWALRQAGALVIHAGSLRPAAARLAPNVPVIQAFMPAFTNVAETLGTATIWEAEAVRERLGVGNRKLILMFGYLRPYKGAEDAVMAMAHVTEDAFLLVAGECWGDAGRFSRVAAAAGVQDRVAFDLRYQPNEAIPALFAAADVVVLPYRAATQSAVATLAFAYERPVVATDVGGLGELVQEGVTGALAEPSNPRSLAQAIDRVLGTEREWALGLAAARRSLTFDRYVTLVEDAGWQSLGRSPRSSSTT